MRLAAQFLLFLLVGVVAGTALLVTAPRLVGYTPFTILTGSMSPAYGVGDVVIDEHIPPTDARPGDVVTFTDPTRAGKTVTHRVERLARDGDQIRFTTKGDANTASETWTVPAAGTIGRVRMRVPKVGWALQWARSREGKIMLIAIPAALLALIELGGLAGAGRRREAPA